MRIAYLECFSGISGDMFLAALLDAGVPARLFQDAVAALNLGARLELSCVTRGGISACKADVFVGNEKELPREVFWEQSKHHHHDPPHKHEHARGLKEIREIISRAALTPVVKDLAIRIFENLGAAEAKIHNSSIDDVHFHEVGAVDAMVDIVCAAVGWESVAAEEWVCSPLNVGSGTVRCAHGTLPVPAPATLELLKDAPIYSSGPQVELVTPTGAAIVRTIVDRFSSFPEMRAKTTAYGAGTREFNDHPNLLRLIVGEAEGFEASQFQQEKITVLEANLDDLSPQVVGYALERLLEEGALDAFGVPVQMKKNRPGTLLTVLAVPEDADRLERIIFEETSTLGVRRRVQQRHTLNRQFATVKTEWGQVRIKVAHLNGTAKCAPEYEDCRRIAREHRIPLKSVMQEALRLYTAAQAESKTEAHH